MRSSIGWWMVAASVLVFAGCASEYVMSTRDGRMIVSKGKPELDAAAGTYVYKDQEGRKAMVKKDDVVQIIER
jgi:hypothetical protein